MNANHITVGVFEAKARWSELLDLVSKGATVTITKRNKPAGRLIPFVDSEAQRRIEAGKAIRTLSKDCRLDGLKIKDLIEEGRR